MAALSVSICVLVEVGANLFWGANYHYENQPYISLEGNNNKTTTNSNELCTYYENRPSPRLEKLGDLPSSGGKWPREKTESVFGSNR